MSHFTKVKTRIAQKEFLLRALIDLGSAPEEGAVTIRGYAGARTPVEIKIPTETSSYDIGFRKVGDTYEMVADWFGIRGVSKQAFLEKLTQRYAYHAARAKLEEQGFTLVSEESTKDGQVHIVLRRSA